MSRASRSGYRGNLLAIWRPRYLFLPLLPAVLAAACACSHSGSAQPAGRGRSLPPAALDQVLTLRLGEEVAVEGGLELKFVSVLSDSRCPQGVDCFWEGNAEIEVAASKPGEPPALLRLNTHRSSPTEAAVLDYTVRLVGLAPHPRYGDQAATREYAASLVVTAREPVG